MSRKRKPVPIGAKYGRLVVIGPAPSNQISRGYSLYAVRAICDCGKEITVSEYKLRDGHTKSCGCLRKELAISRGDPFNKLHKKEYEAWRGMIDRCSINSRAFKHYMGRGIIVCERWLNSFRNFYNDMGDHPGEGYTLDRTDNNKIYEPSNCQWATRHTQTRNQRNNKNVIINGVTMCQTDATRLLNVDAAMISKTVRKLNITHQKVVDILLANPRPFGLRQFRIILEKEKKELGMI